MCVSTRDVAVIPGHRDYTTKNGVAVMWRGYGSVACRGNIKYNIDVAGPARIAVTP